MKEESSSPVQNWAALLGSAALGAASMYFSDPEMGRRRRALLQDKMKHLGRKAVDASDVATRDARNRLAGMQARARRVLLRDQGSENDRALEERVRAVLGRYVSHPHAIEVNARQGQIALSGPILTREKDRLMEAVREVPGVAGIDDRLDAHKRADDISALQGGSGRTGSRSAFMQEEWAPAVRALAVIGGGAVGAYGLARRTPTGLGLLALGVASMVRGLSNQPMKRVTGVHAGRRAVDLQKSIEIMAPREQVFDVWAKVENFPMFMSHVLEVRPLEGERSRWVVQGPLNARVEWTASTTERMRPFVLAWKTDPGSPVEHAGIVRFEESDGGTRVNVRLSYNPPAGMLGHGLAVALGADPKQELDDDLMRMKNLIETEAVPRDAAGAPAGAAGVENRAS